MNPVWLRALILVCIFSAVVLAAEALVRAIVNARAGERAINQRLTMIGRGVSRAETVSILRRTGSSLPAGLPAPIEALGRKIERTLIQAQVRLPTGQLMMFILVAPIVIFFALLLLMTLWWGVGISFGRILISAVFAGVLGAALPLMLIRMKAARIRKRMDDQFPVALDVFVRGLRAGHPVAAALELLTTEMPDPIGSQIGLVVDEVTYGAELRDALDSMAERWDSEDMRMFVVSLSIQSETGGNLAEILENLSRVVRERHSMLLKVRALSSEGRMTATLLTFLPLLAFTMLFLLNPAFFLDVANDPWFLPGFGMLIGLYLIGYFWIQKMIDLKV